jgi:hypothetical protein
MHRHKSSQPPFTQSVSKPATQPTRQRSSEFSPRVATRTHAPFSDIIRATPHLVGRDGAGEDRGLPRLLQARGEGDYVGRQLLSFGEREQGRVLQCTAVGERFLRKDAGVRERVCLLGLYSELTGSRKRGRVCMRGWKRDIQACVDQSEDNIYIYFFLKA